MWPSSAARWRNRRLPWWITAPSIKGKAPDVQLEPGDIVYVPNSPFTTLKRYVNMVVNTFVGTVAANEGIHAAGGTVSTGVSVPVGTGVK